MEDFPRNRFYRSPDKVSGRLQMVRQNGRKYFNANGDVEMMREDAALSAFAALSQEHRLQIVRLLVQSGPQGMPAGALGEKLGAGSSKMSFHLSHLEQAGLVSSHRAGRQIIYRIEIGTLSGLIAFLLQDCCGGRPEYCAQVFATAPVCQAKETFDASRPGAHPSRTGFRHIAQ